MEMFKDKIVIFENEKEKVSFINNIIESFENNSSFDSIGFDDKCVYGEYISGSVDFKPYYKAKKCPGVVFDDVYPYLYFFEEFKNDKGLFNLIFKLFEFRSDYFKHSVSDVELLDYKRASVYMQHMINDDNKVSIKEFSDEECAGCTEISGMYHNIFKIFGYDSSLVVGNKDNKYHSYIIVYPKDSKDVAVLFDPSCEISFRGGKKVINTPYFKVLTSDEYEDLISGYNVPIEISSTSLKIEKFCNIPNGYKCITEVSNYSIGEGIEKEICDDKLKNSKVKKRCYSE